MEHLKDLSYNIYATDTPTLRDVSYVSRAGFAKVVSAAPDTIPSAVRMAIVVLEI